MRKLLATLLLTASTLTVAAAALDRSRPMPTWDRAMVYNAVDRAYPQAVGVIQP
jgi:hypothetical protein